MKRLKAVTIKVAVTGATGQIGRALASCLQRKNIRNQLLVRDYEKASFLQHNLSKIIAFDFNKSETYENALKYADSLFLICDSSVAGEAIALFLESAKEAGIKKIVIMSGIGADKIKTHFLAKLEALVEESTIPYIALRGNWFFQNFGSQFRGMIREAHELSFPDGGASISFVDARDIAEVAFHFLTSELEDMRLGYDITGPESLTHASVAQIFSKYLPYHVYYKEFSETEAREILGWNNECLSLFRDIRNGLTAPVSDVVEQILGKPPRRLENYILENKSLWMT